MSPEPPIPAALLTTCGSQPETVTGVSSTLVMEGQAMHSRYLLIASAALAFAGSAAAEPPKADARDAAQPKNAPAKVLLASADQVQAPAPAVPDAAAPVPLKKRAARVTSCRCGGQTPQQQQQNP
jgi:hypothetical protein